ncbi:MAG: sulfatase [Candidatus Aminicenantaceae bacterium]
MIQKKGRTAAACLSAAAVLFFAAGCGKKEPEPAVYRLMDHLSSGDIRSSPFPLDMKPEENAAFPENSSPLMDLGTGDNPRGLKRKLKLGGKEINALLSPPGSEYEFSPGMNNWVYMDFGIGIKRKPGEQAISGKSAGVIFQIILERDGRRKTVFQEYMDVPPGEDHLISLERLELPYDLSSTRLILSTRGEDDVFSFWHNPVLYGQKSSSRRIILISIDTLRADHLHCYGYERETSPNIDGLAGEGVLFEKTLAPSPWTLPSHVSLLTSLFGAHHQVYREDERMDPALITLADVFHSRGFLCSAFTGGGFLSSVYGFSKGFASYQEGVGGVFHQDSAERVFSAVSEWLDWNREKDFFLFIHTYQPHSPYACPPPYKTMFLGEDARFGHVDLLGHLGGRSEIFRPLPDAERRNIISLYDAEIRYTDERLIGPLLEKLKQMDIYEETLIVFTSDHGEEFFDHGGWGHGQNMYNESLHVPLIIKFPHSRHQGVRVPDWVSLVDIMPTVLEEAGIEYPGQKRDGVTLQTYLEDRRPFSRRIVADVGADVLGFHLPRKVTVIQDTDKVLFRERMEEQNLEFFSVPPPYLSLVEMYRLPEDPGERVNIADQHPTRVNEIIRQVNDMYQSASKRRTGKAEVDQRVKEQLRALGYIR